MNEGPGIRGAVTEAIASVMQPPVINPVTCKPGTGLIPKPF
ncbi:MAG: hypothetical protein ACRC8Y_11500 [Chroococcales cyanobacterium]